MDETSQAIGHLQGRMDAADQMRNRMDQKLDQQTEKLDQLIRMHERQRGERRALHFAASVVGALAGWFFTWWTSKPS